MLAIAALALFASATIPRMEAVGPSLDQGYRSMYNLDFANAHRVFRDWERGHPQDPMGPVSDAAAYLFSEFDRLHVLQSEFFTDDRSFFARERALNPDPALKREFEETLSRGEKLASAILARSPQDENALLATVLRVGLHADYLAMIEKRNFAALAEIKQSRGIAEQLLSRHPQCYDAYLAVGVENYMLSLKPAPIRWLLRAGGAQTDRQTGIERLRLTAEKGRYLMPYARLLLAVAALRDKDTATARRTLVWLSSEFPQNKLYREELSKIK
jgi:hypothetical protein